MSGVHHTSYPFSCLSVPWLRSASAAKARSTARQLAPLRRRSPRRRRQARPTPVTAPPDTEQRQQESIKAPPAGRQPPVNDDRLQDDQRRVGAGAACIDEAEVHQQSKGGGDRGEAAHEQADADQQ